MQCAPKLWRAKHGVAEEARLQAKLEGVKVALLTSSVQFKFCEIDKWRARVFSDGAGGTMAEIGLLPFAHVALQVATRVLPTYRRRFSKHQFTQPQLLAILCLMRYEDWTFREAEVRRCEHRELREALQLRCVPDHTTLYRFLKTAGGRHHRPWAGRNGAPAASRQSPGAGLRGH
jgi:hypothetical protein